MNLKQADLWVVGEDADAIVITTNGTVKRNGELVMGRGCAREAALRFPDLPKFLVQRVESRGNNVHLFSIGGKMIVSFPVKRDWWEMAEIRLIAQSALQLVDLTDRQGWRDVVMPRPGCGNGRLSWWDVQPILEDVLDERFTLVTDTDG